MFPLLGVVAAADALIIKPIRVTLPAKSFLETKTIIFDFVHIKMFQLSQERPSQKSVLTWPPIHPHFCVMYGIPYCE